jgi:cardiolipin synthase
MTITLANLLTLSRMVIVPFFLAAFIDGRMGLALLLFLIAGMTDLVDGTVARMFSRPSKWGAMLDPIADKLLVQSCFISLGIIGALPWWFVGLALFRDIVIMGGIVYLRSTKARLPYRAAIISKITTAFQIAVAVLAMFSLWRPGFQALGTGVETWTQWALYATALLILVSGLNYVSMGCAILKQHRARQA